MSELQCNFRTEWVNVLAVAKNLTMLALQTEAEQNNHKAGGKEGKILPLKWL